MAAHRYWRINCGTTASGLFAIAELQMMLVGGDTNQCAGGTAIASSAYSGLPASNAFDSNPNTCWASTGVTGEYIGYDFGVGVTKDITAVTIVSRNDNPTPNQTPLTGDLQYSDDAITWTTLLSFSVASWSNAQSRTFAPNSARRFWRVNCQTTSGNVYAIAELQMRLVGGGANVCVNGSPLASSEIATYEALKAFDGNLSNAWAATSNAAGEYIGYDFGSTRNITSITIFARNDGNQAQAPLTGNIQSSADGITWGTEFSFVATAWTNGQSQTFATVAPPLTLRASQLGVVSVNTNYPKLRASQLVIVTVISNGKDMISLGPVFKLDCWQPCTAYGTRSIVVNLNRSK